MRGAALLFGAITALTPAPVGGQQVNLDPPARAVRTVISADGDLALRQQLKETKERLQAFEKENEALRRRIASNINALRTLDATLAAKNAESEFFRRQYNDQKLTMEALGIESVGDNKDALKERLLKAVRDLNLTQQAKDALSERLAGLNEAVILLIRGAKGVDPQLRMNVEGQMRAANEAISNAAKSPQELAAAGDGDATQAPELTSASVLSFKEDYALVVANVGAKQGVKAGMPFRVMRGNKSVAHTRVIDVRERICGAVVEDYDSTEETIKVGDRIQVDTTAQQ